jgi:hypothetical protein
MNIACNTVYLTLNKTQLSNQCKTLDYFCLPGHLRCFVNRRVKQWSIVIKKKKKKKSNVKFVNCMVGDSTRRGCVIVGFTITYAISSYHH